jgi:hypothetical protein
MTARWVLLLALLAGHGVMSSPSIQYTAPAETAGTKLNGRFLHITG